MLYTCTLKYKNILNIKYWYRAYSWSEIGSEYMKYYTIAIGGGGGGAMGYWNVGKHGGICEKRAKTSGVWEKWGKQIIE